MFCNYIFLNCLKLLRGCSGSEQESDYSLMLESGAFNIILKDTLYLTLF